MTEEMKIGVRRSLWISEYILSLVSGSSFVMIWDRTEALETK
jgi:hypothetical protein